MSFARLKTSKTNELVLGRGLSFSVPAVDAEPTYAERVIATGPIAYWILGEAAGPTAVDQINSPAQDGTYTGGLLGQPGIGDGNTSVLTDGANDYIDIYSVALNAAFDGTEGTVMIWAKVLNAGVWSDGSFRRIIRIRTDGNNRVYIAKTAAANSIQYLYAAGGVFEIFTIAGHSETGWMNIAVTWSDTADEVTPFFNGLPDAPTNNGVGTWVGGLSVTETIVGASDMVPTDVWNGSIAQGILWDTPLSPATIADLAVV